MQDGVRAPKMCGNKHYMSHLKEPTRGQKREPWRVLRASSEEYKCLQRAMEEWLFKPGRIVVTKEQTKP